MEVPDMLDSQTYRHAVAIKRLLGSRKAESIGFRLFKWLTKNDLDKLDTSKVSFAVIKEAKGYARGEKVFREKIREVIDSGGKVRPILTFRKETRRKISEISDLLQVPIQEQHGFAKKRNVSSAIIALRAIQAGNLFGGSLVCIDLKDAFNGISEKDIYALCRVTLGLNKADSAKFATVMCHKGYLFQGNPIAPQIFNLWSLRIIARFRHWKNVELIQYADDLTFVFKDRDFVPFWVAKEIVRKIEELGFTVNREKLELFSAKSKWAILGLHKCNTQKTEGIKARKTRKLKSKLRLFEHLRSKGAQFTRRLNKLGNPISIDQMEKGLRNWLAVTESLNTLSDLDITKYLNDCQTKSYTIFDFGKNISGRGKRRRKRNVPPRWTTSKFAYLN